MFIAHEGFSGASGGKSRKKQALSRMKKADSNSA
jgi:hypothetical protein